ncbi:hypothetical protein GA0074692_4459 [Micromonospora pallida]|uniref:Uncharacterized protein n=1 Tax=Micromonospora pallida TaxID=145854 RepID=A0A1C6T5L3_9ACTN|nr:hypothetical protein [Micromonospora pallida]SCL36823.1 hypothetical protein GA0074692_4459 [Micromonospora pallida]
MNHTPRRFTELVVTGTRAEIDAVQTMARHCGRLVFMSAPAPVSAADPRLRIVVRLTPTT